MSRVALVPMDAVHRLPERFLAKFYVDDQECWVWTAATSRGYGRFQLGPVFAQAHRVAYEALVGTINEGLTLDHLCRNRACVNPAHLEPVTRAENVLRGETITGQNARKTHCIHGHEFSPENTYLTKDGRRKCIPCQRARQRVYRKEGRRFGKGRVRPTLPTPVPKSAKGTPPVPSGCVDKHTSGEAGPTPPVSSEATFEQLSLEAA